MANGDKNMGRKPLPHEITAGMRSMPPPEELGGRVLSLEHSVEAIADDVSDIRASLGHVATKDEMIGLRQDVRGLMQQMQQQAKTPWPLIFTGLSVLLAIVIAIGGLAYLPIQQITNRNAVDNARQDEQKADRSELARLQVQIDELGARQYDAILRELDRALAAAE